jgi:hypothetical protein
MEVEKLHVDPVHFSCQAELKPCTVALLSFNSAY